jgi:catechol 2,3-dioxygenase-like lactoylglutathione lyase family enzyme
MSKLSAASIYPVLAVDDIKRAVSFYRDKLGFEVQEESEGYARVHTGNGWVTLYKTSSPRGQNTLAAFEVEDVEGTVEYLRQRGVKFEEYDFPGLKTVNGIALEGGSGMRVAWFKDSEGNTLSIAEGFEAAKSKAA